jgi:general secretion pathway protein I
MKSISKHTGFTLIEVLIALAILAIALTAAMRAASVATDSANETKLRTLATWIAQNRIAEINALSVNNLPGVGESNGRQTMANIEFEWRQKISNTPNTAFRKIEVQVLRPSGLGADREQWLANLSGFVAKASP